MKKHKPIILLVVIEILLIFVLYVCGFRITYNPDLINESPYENWLLEVTVDDIPSNLMNESEYFDYLEQL